MMRRLGLALMFCVGLTAASGLAQVAKEFPASWGKPPAIQTRDFVELPDGYDRGSSTLAKWIAENLEKDKNRGASAGQVLFESTFEKAEPGKLPGDFMVLNGEFAVAEEGGNRFLELPGAPLDTFSVLFGPSAAADVEVSARIFGTAKGRRAPTFAVGLGGVSGYKLRVSPGKTALELLKDEEIKASVPFEWKSGTWTKLRLRLRAIKQGEWMVEGMAWMQGGAQPAHWQISCQERAEPVAGRASVVGSPFAGTPIRFDDLELKAVSAK